MLQYAVLLITGEFFCEYDLILSHSTWSALWVFDCVNVILCQ